MRQDFSAMSVDAEKRLRSSSARGLMVSLLFAALLAGCVSLSELIGPSIPDVTAEWAGLLNEIRAFERALGFVPTANFAELEKEQGEFPFCGYASQLTLPYSYEDPAITWLVSRTEQECRAHGGDADVYFS
jgi:hypothetical protein